MPSNSPKQHRFMEAVKHNSKFARKVGVPQSVGEDFVAADKRTGKYAAGGPVGGALGMAGPELLQGQRPGVPNPRMPLAHPMSPMMGGLRGTLQLADHSIMNTGPQLRNMQTRLAKGGKAKKKLSHHGRHAVQQAIHHLKRGDTASAISVLQSSPETADHPDVQAALSTLSGPDPSGGTMASGDTGGGTGGDSGMAGGGKVSKILLIRKAIGSLKDSIFGESDEPAWERAFALLQHIPGSDAIKQKLEEMHAHYTAPPAADFDVADDSHPWNVKNRQIVSELEDAIDQATPGERIPNPNEE